MIKDPVFLLAYLAGVVGLVFQVARLPALRGLFDRLPALVWTYFIPMLSTSAGLIPDDSPLYRALARYLLPASLVLLLLSSELKAIARLGRTALVVMAAGCLGVALGCMAAFVLLRPWLPSEAWKAAGALAGTWIGGSANLIAVGATLGLSPELQGVIIIVDTVVGYTWMGILISLAGHQDRFDRWNGADRSAVDGVGARLADRKAKSSRPLAVADATLMVGLAVVLTAACLWVGGLLPPVGKVLNQFSWAIIILTTVALLLSLTPLSRLEEAGASTLGYAGFYLLLASVGAQGDLRKVASHPQFVLFGVIVIVVHALLTLGAVRLLRAPLFFFGAASQACVGGYSSAPIVAAIYQPAMAPVGLLLAVLGNVIGTYAGLLVAQALSGLAT
ncbi:MAG: hypothetical protein DMF80_21415 [Acidobacteria bacterium]|nr:MAG: hypothetical protein DMF80_21415 [Acidobacteriota bacterium]